MKKTIAFPQVKKMDIAYCNAKVKIGAKDGQNGSQYQQCEKI
jgi:hypothetical protein